MVENVGAAEILDTSKYSKAVYRKLVKSLGEGAMVHASEDDKKHAEALLRIVNVVSEYNWDKGWVEEISEDARAEMRRRGGVVYTERPISESGFAPGTRILIGGNGIGEKEGTFQPFIRIKLPETPKDFVRQLYGYLSGTIRFEQPQQIQEPEQVTSGREKTADTPRSQEMQMTPEQRMIVESLEGVKKVVGRLGMSLQYAKKAPYTTPELRDSLEAVSDALSRIAGRPGSHMQNASVLYIRFVDSGQPLTMTRRTQGEKPYIALDLPPGVLWRDVYNASIGTLV